jgi:nucleoside 2-deoxyribosyltransferase
MSKTAYISIPVKREMDSYLIEEALKSIGLKVNNPCRIDLIHIPPEKIHEKVVKECTSMMDESDIGILHLDYFGKDCSWEIGYMTRRIPVYGVFIHENRSTGSLGELKQYRCSLAEIFNSLEEMKQSLPSLI